jgi:CheY-like chemotaxis protein
VLISKQHLARALTNLVLNAADAIVGAGTITVRARHLVIEDTIAGVEPVEPGDYVVIEVEDSGTGIAEEHLPRIFEPFFSAKQRPGSGGTGLGLAIVHRIVKDAQGILHVESNLGTGTRFDIYLPYQHDVDCPKSARPEPISGGSELILVVDDEVVQLRTARRILEQLGYKVTTVQSGREAVELCRTLPAVDAFDLVIVDMIMPGKLNGLATVDALREIRPEQRVLIASGYAPEQMDITATNRGLTWLAKPYSRARLAAIVRATLDAPNQF